MLYCKKKHDYLSFELPFIRCLIAALHDGHTVFPHAKAKGRKNEGNEKGRFPGVKTDLDSYYSKENF